MVTKTSRVYSEVRDNLTLLLKGRVLAIDPSIGSTSSMPGWAYYNAGELIESGILEINPKQSVWDRLQDLSRLVRQLYKRFDIDILIYEDIPSQRQGGGNANAHASLLKAQGAIMSVPGPRAYVGIFPVSWKRMVRPTYVKSDEADAIEIGYIVLEIAKYISEKDPPKRAN
jgi:Holliday junction resolvasome RuvABC endonuclease subunit